MRELDRSNERSSVDYFATELLEKLPLKDPIFAAYEAQDISRRVGFDFADFDSVVPRALDEIRETKEAFLEEGRVGRDHFGDEIADIMFSFVNLARHAGIDSMPLFEEVRPSQDTNQLSSDDTVRGIDDIAKKIEHVSEISKTHPESLQAEMKKALHKGLSETIQLAANSGFDAKTLLTENVRKYLIRCQAIEKLAQADNKSWADMAANNEIIAYWKKAKSLLSLS